MRLSGRFSQMTGTCNAEQKSISSANKHFMQSFHAIIRCSAYNLFVSVNLYSLDFHSSCLQTRHLSQHKVDGNISNCRLLCPALLQSSKISQTNVLETESSCPNLLENSIATTLIFLHSHTYLSPLLQLLVCVGVVPLSLILILMLLMVTYEQFYVHMCQCRFCYKLLM